MKMIKVVVSMCLLSGVIRIAQTCSHDHDCKHHSCQGSQPHCSQHRCHCESTLLSCLRSSDCSHHTCSSPLHPYCYHSHHSSSRCACQECTHDEDCVCADLKKTPHCYYDRHSHDRQCYCRTPPTTSTAIDSTKTETTDVTTPSSPSIAAGVTGSTKASISCHQHAQCVDHVCPADLHPYCRYNDHSTSCDCTVCTDDSHCTQCSSGVIGNCEFNLTTRIYSCHCDSPNTHSTSSSTQHTTTLDSTTPTSASQVTESSTGQSTSHVSSTTGTKPRVSRKCHVCGNSSNSISCDTRTIYLGNLQTCPQGEDFCMTDIIHDGQANPNIYKRCVTEHECRYKWLQQTSDLEYCMKYGDVPMTGPYSCHFCCVSDGCNAGLIPDKSNYYSKA
ncbi:uncharacterized protein LOC125648466 [Ostrea edulis]|uniref:uncharacterized protein LOC125648466 n=1 Tax=Ostrea edulis TaxID=37623 RepID=UPI0024AF2170|nr:uncharacterized protein LOC125648466 [Ostrea edulis]